MLYFEGVKTLIDIITGEVAFSKIIFAVVMIAGTLLCVVLWRYLHSGKL